MSVNLFNIVDSTFCMAGKSVRTVPRMDLNTSDTSMFKMLDKSQFFDFYVVQESMEFGNVSVGRGDVLKVTKDGMDMGRKMNKELHKGFKMDSVDGLRGDGMFPEHVRCFSEDYKYVVLDEDVRREFEYGS